MKPLFGLSLTKRTAAAAISENMYFKKGRRANPPSAPTDDPAPDELLTIESRFKREISTKTANAAAEAASLQPFLSSTIDISTLRLKLFCYPIFLLPVGRSCRGYPIFSKFAFRLYALLGFRLILDAVPL